MNFKDFFEMPMISLRDKTVFADDKPLKELDVDALANNIVFFRQPKRSLFAPGTTWVYFMDSEESANEMREGKIAMLMVPRATFYRGGSPIKDIWTKRFAQKGTEKILGVIEGYSDEKNIYIDMMTVRPKYKRNSITTKMIQYMKEHFPKAKVTFSSPTPEGKKFINQFDK